MSRDAKDRSRVLKCLTQVGPALAELIIFNTVHGRPVANKKGWDPGALTGQLIMKVF